LSLLTTGGGSFDRHIHFWNTASGSKTASIDTGSQVTSIVWSREYKEFVSSHGSPNNHLSLWSYPTLNKISHLPGHDSRVLHTAISPDGQTVASAASDENLKFWKCFESKQGSDLAKSRAINMSKKRFNKRTALR
jgi:cell division cycle protein 20 (cofactor of APC complex)